MRTQPLNWQRGFTLVELTVVLVLLSIMVVMILPDMRGTFEDELLRSSSRKVLRALQLASSQSMALQHRHRFRLDPAQGRFWVERLATQNEEHSGFVPLTDLPGCEGAVDPRVTMILRSPEGGTPSFLPDPEIPEPSGDPGLAGQNAGDGGILFYPDGTAQGREIVLRDRSGFSLVLHINPTTGRVQLFNPKRPLRP